MVPRRTEYIQENTICSPMYSMYITNYSVLLLSTVLSGTLPQKSLTCDLAFSQEAVHGCLAELRNVPIALFCEATRGLGLL